MSFLQLQGLECRYGDVLAVDGVSLSVARGEFVSLLGPSGCGKTTTLQMIAGFVAPSAGSVSIEGAELTRVPPNRRGVGIVFQSYALFPHMTVAGNVAFGLEMRRVPRVQRQERLQRALEQVHLAHLGARYPRQLSGGQQQRVALARALVIEPRLLLLDEPMSNLDAKLREDMQLELRRLQRSLGITTVMVTHDQNEAMAMSDRIAVMRAGRIIQVDTPRAAYEHPADDFASTFLGKSNNVRGQAGGGMIELPGGLRVSLPGGVAADGAVLCSLRPEKLWVTAPGSGQVRGVIRSRLFLGNHWLFQLTSDLGELLVYQQNTNHAPPEEGDVVGVDWHPASLRFCRRSRFARDGNPGGRATPYWLCTPALLLYGVMLATPLVMTFLLSFNSYDDTKGVLLTWSLQNYVSVLTDGYFLAIFLRTLYVALSTTVICMLIGVPEAWFLSRLQPRWRGLCLLVVLGPLLISVVVRTLGWTILMGRDGLINQALTALHVTGAPVDLLFTPTGLVIALVHVMVPFMVIAVWTALGAVDPATENAAVSLGASQATVFFRIVLPQVMPGVLSGSLIVFSLTASAFATPALIGGRRLKVAATAIYDEFLTSLDWPLGAAIAVLLVAAVLAIMLLWSRVAERRLAGGMA